MAASVDTPSPAHRNKDCAASMASASPIFSPSSDQRFWSALRCRMDTLLEDRELNIPNGEVQPNLDSSIAIQSKTGVSERAKRLKEDSLLLLRGFDSVAHTLSLLSNNIENALQGARDLSKPPTLTEIFHANLKNAESKGGDTGKQQNVEVETKKGLKRKFDPEAHTDDQEDNIHKENQQSPREKRMNKVKNLTVSMATKAATLARELKSIRSDLSFMQERCNLLEEENRRLRDGFAKGIRPEEDDLVRLQLEALLAEKSRLANENANLVRENQCLHQLVEYHQITSQDLSASYEQVLQGMCLEFSSPLEPVNEEFNDHEIEVAKTPQTNIFGSISLKECFEEEKEEEDEKKTQ